MADSRATTHKEMMPEKKIAHIIMSKGENGGHIFRHIHTQKIHGPEEHIFAKGEAGQAHAHLATHMDMPMTNVGAGEGSEDEGTQPSQAAEA